MQENWRKSAAAERLRLLVLPGSGKRWMMIPESASPAWRLWMTGGIRLILYHYISSYIVISIPEQEGARHD